MRTLAPAERRAFRAKAHSLHPVVAIGQHGLTPAVLHEIDVNLLAHELIKIRVFGDDRDVREALLMRICGDLDAAPVQHLGKILTIWRPAPPPEPEPVSRRPDRSGRAGKPAHAGKGTAKKPMSPRTDVRSGVKRAPRRGRSVIVETAPTGNSPRRPTAAGTGSAQSRQSRTSFGKATLHGKAAPHAKAAPHGKSASSRLGASGARRRRKAR